ncbi:hypothetical protein SASPL_149401 [Salvia splendens]|uniref:Jasmonate O-methyltransferase n=2 Tax=Salvia splendens TaxID=180675 RepID=A0A8X8WCH6_SALSN|nr:hypothetical protein SASPL_149401 [Salvia splendens]
MYGGDGNHSYAKNSTYQRGLLDAATKIIEEEIATKLEIPTSSKHFCIADFGCATGSNSFPAMHAIIKDVKQKYKSAHLKTPEFYVYFNDVVSNDFNTLFSSLPPNRGYEVAAVPGDFHRCLLPPSSIHFAYSSCSLHWLMEVPKAAEGLKSPCRSGGEREEVYEGYLGQFERDLESFLKCRALEMVEGGIMALLIPGVPTYWDPQREFTSVSLAELLRSSLLDLTKKGRLSETKLAKFNLPYFFPTPEEVRVVLEKSKSFSIERMEILKSAALLSIDGYVACFRAAHQNMFSHKFGAETVDEIFDLLKMKLQTFPVFANPCNDKSIVVVAILKHSNV